MNALTLQDQLTNAKARLRHWIHKKQSLDQRKATTVSQFYQLRSYYDDKIEFWKTRIQNINSMIQTGDVNKLHVIDPEKVIGQNLKSA